MKAQIADIVNDLISSLSDELTQDVISFSTSASSTIIAVEKTYHLRAKMNVKIDDVDYEVSEIDGNLIIINSIIANPLTVEIPTPFYFHGTPRNTNIEIGTIKSFRYKYPMAWLLEILRDRHVLKYDSVTDRECNVSIFFLDYSNGDWTTDMHYDKVIERMYELAILITDKIIYGNDFAGEEIDHFDIIPHSNFGKYVKDKGYDSNIFDDTTSGVQLNIKLPIRKSFDCN